MNTTDEFLKALQDIQPLPTLEIEYRFYYDETGGIVCCSQSNHQENGNYIVVSEDEYNHYYQYRVENSKLKKIDAGPRYRVQLKHSNQGYCVAKNHVSIIIEDETYQDVEYYEKSD